MRPVEFTPGMRVLRGEIAGVDDLPVLAGRYVEAGPALISCWQMTFGDLVHLLLGGLRVYVSLLGTIHPLIVLETKPPHLIEGEGGERER